MNKKPLFVTLLLIAALGLGACTPTAKSNPTATNSGAGIANPASENCTAVGGKLEIATRGDGGQYGICYFEDNRQCEEWALMRGDCPAGGLKVTGYVTDAAVYCAITGGEYAVTEQATDSRAEQGACTLKSGTICDAVEYFNGTCPP